jgi:integrase
LTATVEADKARGSYLDPDAGKVTLKRYANRWLAAQTFDVTSRESVEMHLRLHVYPVLGGQQLRAIKPSTIQAWLRGLTMSSTSQRMILGNVSSIFNAAVDDELVTRNPCRAGSVRTPRLDPRKVVPWPVERVGSVRDALADRYRVVATLAAGLGLRQGEVFGPAVEDVDFLRGTVKVRRQVRLFSTGGQAFRLPKGRKDRTIPLPNSVRDALAAHLALYPARPVCLPWDTTEGGPVTVELLVTTPDGNVLQRNNFNRAVWAPALRAAGVESSRGNGMHALRHFWLFGVMHG